MIGQMAFAIALPGFNDLGRSVTPIFLLMDHFLYRFSTFSKKKMKKKKKIYPLEFFAKCAIELLLFRVTPFKIDQIINQNRSIDKVQKHGNERR